MKTAIFLGLAASVSIFSTLSILQHRDWLFVFSFALLLGLGVAIWRLGRPWWLSSVVFSLMGVSHILGKLWLRSRGLPSSSALDTFGVGFLAFAIYYFFRNRRLAGYH